ACVQQVLIRSTYRWEGEVRHDDEVLLLVKTRATRFDDVAAVVGELHSYDVPAVTAVPIVRGSADYLAWIDAETHDIGTHATGTNATDPGPARPD
ncbi:MAG: divalent-cation tolerance protein CutA, partial [Acidimicrobiia bacterium]